MLLGWISLVVVVAIINAAQLVQGKCSTSRNSLTPTLIYDDLRCTPKYISGQADCPEAYDCSHIFDRPQDTCHFKAKFYKVGQEIDNEELTDVWDRDCSCSKSLEFTCPEYEDGCAEDWVGDYPKPNCYLRYELNQYCAMGEICPPFEGNAKCEVNGVTYREGDKFWHPDNKCVECLCDKSFDGLLEPPFCQPLNCTAEIQNSKMINNFCAPFYKSGKEDKCCPDSWICPEEHTIYHPNPVAPALGNTDFHCKYGATEMNIGEIAVQTDPNFGEVTCECTVPPFLYCTVRSQTATTTTT